MNLFFLLDPLYLMMMLPALILAGLATYKTKATFARFAKIRARSGLTGAEAARKLLDAQGLSNVRIQASRGFLSDHYNPMNRTLNLSKQVYQVNSLSAIGVACHEAGHAIQHARHFTPLTIRTAMVPVTQFGTNGAYVFLILGFLTGAMALAKIGVILFALGVLFSVITLPVEWDASRRAKQLMVSTGIVGEQERAQAGQVLNAAFLTYVASAVTALLTLLYYLIRLGLLGGGDD